MGAELPLRSAVCDHGEEFDRELDQASWPVDDFSRELQCIAGFKDVTARSKTVLHNAFEHVEKLNTWVLKERKDLCSLVKGHKHRLHDLLGAPHFAEHLILVPHSGSLADDLDPLSRFDKKGIMLFFEATEKGGQWDGNGLCQF